MFLLAYPVEPTRHGTATSFIQNIAEKDNVNAETETKPFTQNTYLSHFL